MSLWTLSNIAFTSVLAGLIVVALFIAYGLGYRNGVAYCVRELGPFHDLVKSLREMKEKK